VVAGSGAVCGAGAEPEREPCRCAAEREPYGRTQVGSVRRNWRKVKRCRRGGARSRVR